jgi:hypothetical protein
MKVLTEVAKTLAITGAVIGLLTGAIASEANVDVEVEAHYGTAVAGSYDGVAGGSYGASVGLLWDDKLWIRGGWGKDKDVLLGQPMSKNQVATVEGGIRVELVKDLSLRLGGGYWFPYGVSQTPEIIDEMTYTHLVNNHYNPGRPIPLDEVSPGRYFGCSTYEARGQEPHPNCFQSTYDLDPSLFFTVELSYNIWRDLDLGLSYRHLPARSYIAIGKNDGRIYQSPSDVDNAAGGGWWMEHGTRNFSTLNVVIRYRF